jgi:hypothetical protein
MCGVAIATAAVKNDLQKRVALADLSNQIRSGHLWHCVVDDGHLNRLIPQYGEGIFAAASRDDVMTVAHEEPLDGDQRILLIVYD